MKFKILYEKEIYTIKRHINKFLKRIIQGIVYFNRVVFSRVY